jgi:error-prone DNA polymerase
MSLPLPQYAELHCLTNFSFLRGASHPEELVGRAQALGYAALAVTDECSLAGVVRAHVAAKAAGLKLLIGTEFRLADGAKLVLLATNRSGYGNLSELITRGRRSAAKGSYRLTRADLDTGIDDCLALLLPQSEDLECAPWLAQAFPHRAWIAAELHCGPDDRAQLARLRRLSEAAGLPLVAAGDAHMHVRSRRSLQDVLTAVRLGAPVAGCGQALFPNGERHLRSRVRLAQLYPHELLAETLRIADRCRFSLDELRYEYPEELVPAGEAPAAWLRRLVEDGLRWRFASLIPAPVREQIEHELRLIEELGFEPYFLTVHDIVRFARERGILCQGRGSAANSAVCYALGITEVDPARMSMLFERFISKERNEPPDIDVDFEHQRREEVIQYLYAKYGRDRAALAATVITYRTKSVVRDLGKALGLDAGQVDRLAGSLAWWDGRKALPARIAEAGLDPESRPVRQLLELAGTLVGFPRHLSQHTGGFVIARDRLSRLVPIENAAMPERSVIEWDKDDLDSLGLLKVDVLALGMLSAIRRAFDFIDEQRGRPFGMADVPPEDPATYAMIQRADTIGVFQIESRAQMSMLPRLKPASFFDLVIEVAIVRPGPIQGGMVHPYLRRRQGLEPVSYPSEAVKSVLERTMGVSIFQEQVMQLAVVAAGFTPGEADKLRRAMAAWKRKGGIGPFREKLISGMLARGYTAEYAEQIFKQIQGFGEYGFPESHAASFGLLVYVSSWLKRHQPAAFCAALLDSQPLGFYAPAQIVRDAVEHGVEVRAIDVTASDWACTLEPAAADARQPAVPAVPAVRLGLELVSGFNETAALRLVAARRERTFVDAEDLARRAQLDRGEIHALAAADALAALAGHRRSALWAALGLDTEAPRPAPLAARTAAESAVDLLAPTEGQDIVADYDHTALTLRRHPLALLRERFERQRFITAAGIRSGRHRQLVRTTGIVTCRQRPSTASGVTFITLEDETGTINVVVWRATAERYRRAMLASTLLTVYGHIERVETAHSPVVHLIAARLLDHSTLLGELVVPARNFH